MNDSNVTAEATWPWNIEYLSAICSTLPVSTSLLNFAMNSIIIVIIVTQIRNTARRPHPCNIHLIFLAISDISIGVSFVGGALWLHLIDLQRVVDIRLVFYFIIFATFVNRTLTLYITFTRAWCLFHSQVAVVVDQSRAQSTNYTIAHVFKWAISPGVGMFLLSTFIPDFFVHRQIIERRSADLILFGMFLLTTKNAFLPVKWDYSVNTNSTVPQGREQIE